jgi:integrase/recombinase XerD
MSTGELPGVAYSSTEIDRAAPEDLLTPDEARTLIRTASGRAPTGVRNRALIAIMYRAGLRPGEALALAPGDVDLDAGTALVPARKGGERRLVGLDAGVRELLQRWQLRRRQREIAPAAPLFCTLAGESLKAAYVRELLPRLARKAGITKRVHPLALRYANAAELAEEGYPPAFIDRHLGLAVPGNARRYMRQFNQAEVVAAVAGRQWRP